MIQAKRVKLCMHAVLAPLLHGFSGKGHVYLINRRFKPLIPPQNLSLSHSERLQQKVTSASFSVQPQDQALGLEFGVSESWDRLCLLLPGIFFPFLRFIFSRFFWPPSLPPLSRLLMSFAFLLLLHFFSLSSFSFFPVAFLSLFFSFIYFFFYFDDSSASPLRPA